MKHYGSGGSHNAHQLGVSPSFPRWWVKQQFTDRMEELMFGMPQWWYQIYIKARVFHSTYNVTLHYTWIPTVLGLDFNFPLLNSPDESKPWDMSNHYDRETPGFQLNHVPIHIPRAGGWEKRILIVSVWLCPTPSDAMLGTNTKIKLRTMHSCSSFFFFFFLGK